MPEAALGCLIPRHRADALEFLAATAGHLQVLPRELGRRLVGLCWLDKAQAVLLIDAPPLGPGRPRLFNLEVVSWLHKELEDHDTGLVLKTAD